MAAAAWRSTDGQRSVPFLLGDEGPLGPAALPGPLCLQRNG